METVDMLHEIERCSGCGEVLPEDEQAVTCFLCGELAHPDCTEDLPVARATELDPEMLAPFCRACLDYRPDWDGIRKEWEIQRAVSVGGR